MTPLPPCTDCGQNRRRRGTPPTPGHVLDGARGYCETCYGRLRSAEAARNGATPVGTCHMCQRPMRPTHVRTADMPGTVARRNKTTCNGCAKSNRTPPPPTRPTVDPDWMDQAACTDYNPELWFDGHQGQIDAAIEVCQTECPVKATCLAVTMWDERDDSRHYRHGIAGGLTPAQRWNLATGKKAVA